MLTSCFSLPLRTGARIIANVNLVRLKKHDIIYNQNISIIIYNTKIKLYQINKI